LLNPRPLKSAAHKVLSLDGKSARPLTVLSGPARGVRLMLDVRSQSSYWIGAYDRWITDRVPIANFLKAGDTAWDCGAFVGYYTVIFRTLVGPAGSVFSFEASGRNFRQVACVPDLNGWKNVTILNCAVGPAHATILFSSDRGGASGPIGLLPGVREEVTEGIEKVESCGVDELVNEKDIALPDFIKFDLETGEVFALKNANGVFTRKRPYILLELHGREALDAAIEFLVHYEYLAAPVHELPKIRALSQGEDMANWYKVYRQEAERFSLQPPFDPIPHMTFLLPREKLI
jgi:FkbM family methyltransferase